MFDDFSDLFSQEWFESAKMFCGNSLTDEMIQESVHEASDFFHIDDPAVIAEHDSIGVFINGSNTVSDDILIFSREQMEEMGITSKGTFDLVMTHEAAHRMLQGMDAGLDVHQEELCCDFMAGVRAGLNDINFSGMQDSLATLPESESHPAGASRVYSIKEGADFAEIYCATHGEPPTFIECLDHFKENVMGKAVDVKEVTLREYSSAETTGSIGFTNDSFHRYGDDSAESAGGVGFADSEHFKALDDESAGGIGFADGLNAADTETTGSIGFANTDVDESNPSFKGYTQDEINRNMAKAEKEQRYHEAEARHHRSMANHGLSNADTQSHLREAEIHQKRANEWKSEYQKWKWTKAEPK